MPEVSNEKTKGTVLLCQSSERNINNNGRTKYYVSYVIN